MEFSTEEIAEASHELFKAVARLAYVEQLVVRHVHFLDNLPTRVQQHHRRIERIDAEEVGRVFHEDPVVTRREHGRDQPRPGRITFGARFTNELFEQLRQVLVERDSFI